jgi:hypothetical protein
MTLQSCSNPFRLRCGKALARAGLIQQGLAETSRITSPTIVLSRWTEDPLPAVRDTFSAPHLRTLVHQLLSTVLGDQYRVIQNLCSAEIFEISGSPHYDNSVAERDRFPQKYLQAFKCLGN